MSCGIIQVVEAQVKAQGDSMNDSKTKENKEPMDESNVDWSTFAEDFMKLWSGSKISPELNKNMTAEELMNVVRKTRG